MVSFQGMEYFFGPHKLIFYTGAGQQAGLLHVFWCPNLQACRHGEAGGGCLLNWGWSSLRMEVLQQVRWE